MDTVFRNPADSFLRSGIVVVVDCYGWVVVEIIDNDFAEGCAPAMPRREDYPRCDEGSTAQAASLEMDYEEFAAGTLFCVVLCCVALC
mmetsp:Transcript_102824/g.209612  ORF Transcript_102824/g.209612 Transcript_102824/m.209612 type:complete len:88 (-) Transcript_102824:228-491(-)